MSIGKSAFRLTPTTGQQQIFYREALCKIFYREALCKKSVLNFLLKIYMETPKVESLILVKRQVYVLQLY